MSLLLEETSFDAIVVGTSLQASVVSASLAARGLSVLHLDAATFYGGRSASLEARALEEVTGSARVEEAPSGRDTTLDVSAKLLFCAGSLVHLLVRSGVTRYVEFKAAQKCFFGETRGGQLLLEGVPASRSDVFQSESISLLQKRMLMRMMQSAEVEEGEWRERPFGEYLREHCSLQERLATILETSVAFSGPRTTAREGKAAMRRYLASIGRFQSPTPFLYPLYGGGELSQAFCRASAVKGATFILGRDLRSVQGENQVVDSEGQTLTFKRLFLDPERADELFPLEGDAPPAARVYRAAILTTQSIAEGQDGVVQVSLEGASMLQVDSSLHTCAKGTFAVYVWGPQEERVREVAASVREQTHAWFYSAPVRALRRPAPNVCVLGDVDASLGYHAMLEEVREALELDEGEELLPELEK